ncbi:methyl-accepting chemotaxis protein [Noviherbaspirillum sp. CPCC 100848]|uniref:Methyl-accepting chemotaxis protein n=1 Tax=Noviherbaspirillum album TaxID=3080276 RepID=A0ABU6JG82_9BURK|nr:methyl-accepting chemotaxis protein [Noviherbaspirillum sp. CPCC 100848]MEC4722548.1 methyl-accepting chemotaxis protein [Noviherbaspirillum sp. CPCC 100848]
MKLKDLKIGTRLGAAFALVLALTAMMTGLGIFELSRVAAAKNEMAEASQKRQLAEEWLRGISTNAVRTFAKAKSDNADDQLYFEREMTATSKRLTEIQKELERLVLSEEGKRLISNVGDTRKVYLAARDNAFQLKKENPEAAEELKAAIDTKMVPAMNAYLDSVKLVLAFQGKVFDIANARIDEVYADAKLGLAGLGALALALGALLAWLLARSITHPLRDAVDIAQTVAAGDLTRDIDARSQDEVGRLLAALKQMNASLLKTVLDVRNGTDMIATASHQIAAGNLDLSSRTEQQASSLQETASSMEELAATVRQNAEHARRANTLAIDASGAAAEGGSVIEQVVGTMSDISASAKQIVDIISVIDGIAFQTNILALNAAVEAARAGEQGRGFAVVAGEVRTLAQRSAAAAKEIKALINTSVERVETGNRLVGSAGSSMQNIVESVRKVTDIMGEISAASQEQTAGIDQINQAVTQMDQVTQQNAALVEEAAAASESLQDQAAKLAQVVSVFKLGAMQGQQQAIGTKPPAVTGGRPKALPAAAARHIAVAPRHAAVAQRPASRVPARSNGDEWEEF